MEALLALFAPISFIDELLLKFSAPKPSTRRLAVHPDWRGRDYPAGWAAYASYLSARFRFHSGATRPMRVGPWGLLQPIADAISCSRKKTSFQTRLIAGSFSSHHT